MINFLKFFSHTIEGLKKVLLDAIPFFPMQVLSNFFFSILFFGLHTFIFRRRENKIISEVERGTEERLV
jgi:ABC-type polysaccharide/polyol phosphate export permease